MVVEGRGDDQVVLQNTDERFEPCSFTIGEELPEEPIDDWERWTLLEEDDWSLRYDEGAWRPGARLLASFAVVGDYAYLFGGVTVLERGFVLRALNDFWRYHVPTGGWEMIHPDTGWCNFVNRPSHPPIRGVHTAVAVGTDIYIFGGWPGTVPVFTVNDLWRYDTVPGSWEQHSPWRSREQGAGYDAGADYPGSR